MKFDIIYIETSKQNPKNKTVTYLIYLLVSSFSSPLKSGVWIDRLSSMITILIFNWDKKSPIWTKISQNITKF